jgi:hypothetical protein
MYSSSGRHLCWLLSFLTLLASISSCDDPLGPKKGRRIGVTAFFGDPVVITVPDTVLVGESFLVSVRTSGDGCMSQEGTEVDSAGPSIDIRPYDVHSGARICASILNMFDHTATLTVMQPGTAQIRVHGKQLPGDLPISEVREVVVK